MSERVLDARLHGHGGGVDGSCGPSGDKLERLKLLGICVAYEQGVGHAERDLVNPYAAGSDEHAAYAIGKHRGLDNPFSLEPVEDAEVREAINGECETHGCQAHEYQDSIIEYERLRSQAGQGKVVTVETLKQIMAKHKFRDYDSYGFSYETYQWDYVVEELNTLLAAQKPREMSGEVFPIPWSESNL